MPLAVFAMCELVPPRQCSGREWGGRGTISNLCPFQDRSSDGRRGDVTLMSEIPPEYLLRNCAALPHRAIWARPS